MSRSLREEVNRFDPDLPLERAHTIPSSWYADPDIYALERRAIFANTWLVAGRSDAVAEPGSFLTTDIGGEPILVVRDSAGVLRAFFNVCRHRAAVLMTEAEGQVTRLRCRYHGWTYDLAGRLRGVPEFEGVADFCREDNGLASLAVDTWGPLVWINTNLTPGPLAEFLAPLINRSRESGLESLRFVQRRQYTVACNWKVFVDNYLDGGYHVNTIHPSLARVLDYAAYRTEIAGETSVQISPLKPDGAGEVGKVRAGANAYYWWVFPNFMMNVYQGVMDTNLVLPLGPDRCRVIFDFYFAETEGAAAQQTIAQSIEVADRIQQEDMAICQDVQRGLGSQAFDTGRFSVRREAGGYHFHRLLAQRLQAAVR